MTGSSHKLVLGSVNIKTILLISSGATKYSNCIVQYSGVSYSSWFLPLG